MATNLVQQSYILPEHIKEYLRQKKPNIGIVVAEWNSEITERLLAGAYKTLMVNGISENNIFVIRVPGSFELVMGAKYLINYAFCSAVIALGCVIRGETPHFEYVSSAVTQGITQLNTEGQIPVIFGVLTTNNIEQARDRAGGKYGNKGAEAAIAALKMYYTTTKLVDSDTNFLLKERKWAKDLSTSEN